MSGTALSHAVRFGWLAAGFAVASLLTVLFSRMPGPVVLPAFPDSDVPTAFRGTAPRIHSFYTATPKITRGEQAVICYGVQNVRSVRLEPAVHALGPSLSRCFGVSPAVTTAYTLAAEGADGQILNASLTVEVQPPKPWFSMLGVSAKEVVRGDRWAVCYSTENALAVRLEPNGMTLPTGRNRCLQLYPTATMTFRLIAAGENGMQAVERIPVAVTSKRP